MNRVIGFPLLVLAGLLATASSASGQRQYIGYVYPGGGQQGTTFPVKVGGQKLDYVCDAMVSGEGVSARVVLYYDTMNNRERRLLRDQERALRKKGSEVRQPMVAKMASFEFPARIGPEQDEESKKDSKKKKPATPKAKAKQKLLERIQRKRAADNRRPASRAIWELVFLEVNVAPDAKPGRREIRLVTKQGVSNPLPFYVGQVPEVARKAMGLSDAQVLGKEYLAQRKRPPEEEEMRVTVPCTMNGQVASGEVNRYRFEAKKGQQLVITVKARQLIPYIADAVPGWFQAVLTLCDANGKELAYNDDFRFKPDPTLYFEVPDDGEYVLSITDAIYRGREDFVYRITIGEMPFVTSIFPLGARVGEPVKIETNGWNLDKTKLAPPPSDAKPGTHLIAATNGKFSSNYVPFALGTMPECLDKENNGDSSKAQKVKLPIVVNGRVDQKDDWDVFEVAGHRGDTLVAEVHARRLDSPLDSFLKVTDAEGKVLAFNDDHHDAGSGMNTNHADSYLIVKLPADGKYFVHLGDTTRHGGKEYAYRLRISPPRPDFQLRVVPSRVVIRSKKAAAVTVYAMRKDDFDGPIKLAFKDLPKGLESSGATLAAKKDVTRVTVKTTLKEMDKPVNLTLVGTAKIGGREIVREAVPAEDAMQAFLWRHLLPAEDLVALVYDPSYKPPVDRQRPAITDDQRPPEDEFERKFTERQLAGRLRQIEGLYEQWLLTDDFTNRLVAELEAQMIKEKEEESSAGK